MLRSRFAPLVLALCLGATAAVGCGRPPSDESAPVLVFAASNLREALTELARTYRAAGGDSLVMVFGATGDLTIQITNGAPADLFLAADEAAVDSLVARGLLDDRSRVVYAIGRLALIWPCAEMPCGSRTLQDLADSSVRMVAIADPRYAPYGLAARQALERADLWPHVKQKIVMGATVSQAEQFVRSGNADAGLVSLSLAIRATGLPYAVVDTALHDPLTQSAGVVRHAAHATGAAAVLAFLRAPVGIAILERYGFEVPASQALSMRAP